jgi:TonB family protein
MSAPSAVLGRQRSKTEAAIIDPLADLAISQIQKHTHWSLSASTILHALLLTWLILLWRPETEVSPITEISFMEPGDLAGPVEVKSTSAAAEVSAPGELAPGDRDEQFRRGPSPSELRLDAQSPSALEDRLNARLAAIQGTAGGPSAGVVASAPASLWGSSPANVTGSGAGGTSPVALKRGGEGSAPSITLTRGGSHDVAPALVATSGAAERAASDAPAKGGENLTRRTLAGVTLIGPIADRAIVAHTTPVYPDWAKRDAVEGSVTLYFVVRADGTVKENILVQKTAGFEEFDENARAALAAWRFEPLHDGRTGEQWGNITFHFRLRGGA